MRFIWLPVLAVGCSSGPRPAAAPATPAHPAAAKKAAAPEPGDVFETGRVPRGAPHAGNIESVRMSPDGKGAISRDVAGRLRLWTALDGSAEPRPLPEWSASHYALARGAAGWTIALLDSAGAAHLLRAGHGGIERLAELPPRLNMVDVEVMPGGERVALLRSDRVIELRSASGELLASYDKRQFRPDRIRLAGASGLVAVSVDPGADEASLTVQRFHIDRAGRRWRITPAGEGTEIAVPAFAIERHQSGTSPDGRRFAFLSFDRRTSKWSAVIVDLAARTHREVPLDLVQQGSSPSLGFVADDRLVVRGGVNAASWEIEADSGVVRSLAVRADVVNNTAKAFAPGRMLVGMGTWLYSRRFPGGEVRYLGYQAFSPMAAAVSPSAEVTAWGSDTRLFLESAGGQLRWREMHEGQVIRHLSWVDDRRLLVVYHTGVVELYDVAASRSLALRDGGGGFSSAAYDAAQRLLVVMPLGGQAWVTEVKGDHLAGPYVIADGATRFGFLDGDQGLWTLDAAGRLRTYAIGELRAGLSSRELAQRGALIRPATPIAVGRDGSLFVVAYRDGSTHLTVYGPAAAPPPASSGGDAGNGPVAPQQPPARPPPVPTVDVSGNELATIAVTSVNLLSPSPDGNKIAIATSNLVELHDAHNLESAWTFPVPNGIRGIEWSADGRFLTVPTQEGAVVLRAADGEPAMARCGVRFMAQRTPPPNLFTAAVRASVCEM